MEGYGTGDGRGEGGMGGDIVCIRVYICARVCPYCNAFVTLNVRWAPFASSSSVFFPSSVLPHTFEHLCGIVPWSWLGSLIPRPRLPPGQLAHAPQIRCCQPGHGSQTRSPESSEARGACPPDAWGSSDCCCQFRTRLAWGSEVGICLPNCGPNKWMWNRCFCVCD